MMRSIRTTTLATLAGALALTACGSSASKSANNASKSANNGIKVARAGKRGSPLTVLNHEDFHLTPPKIGPHRQLPRLTEPAAFIGAGQTQARPPKPQKRTAHATNATAYTAQVSTSVSELTVVGACNWYEHTNGFNSLVLLNETRFPNGAYVAVRYAYERTGTSTWNYTPWYSPNWISNLRAPVGADGLRITGPTILTGMQINVSYGQYYVLAEVAVWNGHGYEYTYEVGSTYRNSGQYGTSPVDASSCWVSSS